jgi:hypothetical protein
MLNHERTLKGRQNMFVELVYGQTSFIDGMAYYIQRNWTHFTSSDW